MHCTAHCAQFTKCTLTLCTVCTLVHSVHTSAHTLHTVHNEGRLCKHVQYIEHNSTVKSVAKANAQSGSQWKELFWYIVQGSAGLVGSITGQEKWVQDMRSRVTVFFSGVVNYWGIKLAYIAMVKNENFRSIFVCKNFQMEIKFCIRYPLLSFLQWWLVSEKKYVEDVMKHIYGHTCLFNSRELPLILFAGIIIGWTCSVAVRDRTIK